MDKNENDSVVSFLIEDFKDTSEKLEYTDKKCQFVIQLYGSLIAVLITLFTTFWQDSKVDTQMKIYEIITSFVILIIIGNFIYRYVAIGGKIHTIYLNRMNKIRCLVLDLYGMDFTKYSFTRKVKSSSKGMGYTMEVLLIALVSILFFILIWYLLGLTIAYPCIINILVTYLAVKSCLLFIFFSLNHKAECIKDAEKQSEEIFRG